MPGKTNFPQTETGAGEKTVSNPSTLEFVLRKTTWNVSFKKDRESLHSQRSCLCSFWSDSYPVKPSIRLEEASGLRVAECLLPKAARSTRLGLARRFAAKVIKGHKSSLDCKRLRSLFNQISASNLAR